MKDPMKIWTSTKWVRKLVSPNEGQQEFDESSDEEVTDDNNSQGQQDETGTSTNFLFGAT